MGASRNQISRPWKEKADREKKENDSGEQSFFLFTLEKFPKQAERRYSDEMQEDCYRLITWLTIN